jgi:L-lysine 6-transaminase
MEINSVRVHEILGRHMLADGYDLVLDLEKSRGTYLADSKTGALYLDFFTFFGSLPMGHNHPSMTEPDFLRKLGRLAVNKPANSDLYTVELAEFVDTFFRLAAPDYMKYIFFISGGALAVENGLKAAMDWKVRKNRARGIEKEQGQQIIHFTNAFHGRSGYTLSLTNTSDRRKTKYFAKFNWPRVSSPIIKFPLTEKNLLDVKKREESAIDEIMNILNTSGDDIAALIIEPIQGEGGDNHFREEFFRKLRDICLENEVLLIVDEVQTGIGITGKMWAHEHFGIEPDIIVFGKKTQVCGFMAGKRLDEVENHVFRESSRINSTFGGNLVDMVRCSRYLKIIHEEKILEHAAETGVYLHQKLLGMEKSYPELTGNVRGRGLMCAFDLPDRKTRDLLIKACYKNRLLLLPCGSESVRFRPPLNVNREEIDRCIEIVIQSLEEDIIG